MTTPQRRLSAILHPDVAGFVRLMEGDEDLTVRHLKSAQAEVWRPAIETAGGTLIDNPCDSLLSEFGSARDAVAAALDIPDTVAHLHDMSDPQRPLSRPLAVQRG